MEKIRSFWRQFRLLFQAQPALGFTFLWVTLLPPIGSVGLIHQLTHIPQNELVLPALWVLSIAGGLVMGLALLPTTLCSAILGFLWGWPAFLPLVLAYTLATALGYSIGLLASKEGLQPLLKAYPKAQKKFEQPTRVSQLILFVRLSPVIPFALSNVLFAGIRTGLVRTLIFGTLGMLPRTLLAFIGGIFADSLLQSTGSQLIPGQRLLLLLLLLVSIWGVFRFFTSNKL